MSIRPLGASALALVALAACMHVPPAPLDPDGLLARVRQARDRPRPDDPLTLAEAVAHMRRHNPAIREARAAWRAAAAVARVPTPPPNPTIGLGPLLVGGTDILRHGALGFEAALGWSVLLGNPRVLRDDLNRVRAAEALAEAAAVERATYLDVRADLAAAILRAERAAVHEALVQEGEAAVGVGRELAEAGQAGAVDVRLLALDAARARAAAVEAEGAAVAGRHALAAHLGLAADAVVVPGPEGLPAQPDHVPPVDELEALALAHHPRLAAIRAAYVTAEKELRLEVAEAMPDFEMGLSFENEAGDLTLGLPFSIELPLWDRNQQGIAAACATRSRVRVRYTAALQRLLARIAAARAALEAARAKHVALEDGVATAVQRTRTTARESLEAGTVDALRYLQVLRAERAVARERIEASIELFAAWSALEQAVGAPLLSWAQAPAGVEVAAGDDVEGDAGRRER